MFWVNSTHWSIFFLRFNISILNFSFSSVILLISDFAFVLHSLSYLSSKGRAALVCFPGVFYRGGAEQKIRKYLVDNNYVETIIDLAPNLFYGTTIAVTLLVLSKHKTDN